ncbi:MAG TPA: cytochrome c [Vicinamibacterales bacterium]|nr:cytochrome c [Vicinamibacterales bacterium]
MTMMRLACVNCHGSTGHGGPVFMTGQAVQAADITWPALTETQQPQYTDDTVKRAITQGLDPSGAPLDDVMPRWSMSPQDLDDLVAYLRTLR